MYKSDYSEEAAQALSDENKNSYLYRLQQALNVSGDDLELLKHSRIFALADIFRMIDLKTFALEKFKTQLQHH